MSYSGGRAQRRRRFKAESSVMSVINFTRHFFCLLKTKVLRVNVNRCTLALAALSDFYLLSSFHFAREGEKALMNPFPTRNENARTMALFTKSSKEGIDFKGRGREANVHDGSSRILEKSEKTRPCSIRFFPRRRRRPLSCYDHEVPVFTTLVYPYTYTL